ncbi:TIR domain-containing protein [Pseudofrankia saprophytica]|uniref:nSTAND1 domain-containing NTPase n=1 Tax=Pseudofrankia saprophytica TaxID=298655 RepID=UPI0006844085|nr:TIR domain-containing protein [Pseudofrankia saprophytica]OHV33588.1 hypothetical protein BCD49_26535 [Pseudofrankia sp. EUN1h]
MTGADPLAGADGRVDDGADFFVSYTAADRGWAEWISWQLEAAGDRVLIQAWDFGVGSHFVHEMHRAASTAARTVAVVSAAYLTSAYGEAEWQAAWAADPSGEGRRLLVVRVEDCPRPGLLGQVVGIDLFGLDQREAGERLRAAVLGVRAKPRRPPVFPGGTNASPTPPRFPGPAAPWDAAWQPGRSPFPGLSAFDASRAAVFKGRDDDARLLAGRLAGPVADGAGLLAVVGPSGCGKSSLVAAGLAPRLADDPDWLVTRPMVPGVRPLAALAGVLAEAGRARGLGWDRGGLVDRLTEPGMTMEVVEELLAAADPPARRLLLVVDQAEELLTAGGEAGRERLLEVLAAATAGPARVVMTLRSEYLDRLIEAATPAGLRVRAEALHPLSRDLLPLVISGPARLAGLAVDEELVARMVADTGDGQALPLLAYTLQRLHAEARETGSTVLSAALYDRTGGVRGALVEHADTALAEATAAAGRTEEEVLAGLLRLITVDAEGRPTRRRVPLDQLPDPVRGTLTPFVARRLLAVDSQPGGPATVEVTHERLLTAWTPLATAISQASDRLRQRAQAEAAADDWDRRGRPVERLWNLGLAAGTLAAVDLGDLTSTARDFLTTGRRHGQRRRRRTIAVLTVLLLLVTAGGTTATAQWINVGRQRQEAIAQRNLATARALVTQAERLRDRDPAAALPLNLAAERLVSSFEARSSLAATLAAAPWTGAADDEQNITQVAFSPEGRTVATASYLEDRGRLRLFDASDPAHPTDVAHVDDDQALSTVQFSPGGRTLLTISGQDDVDGARLRLYDVSDPRHPVRTASFDDDLILADFAFSPDGRTLAVACSSIETGRGHLRLYDLGGAGGPARTASIDDDQNLVDVVFSPDGRTLATASSGITEGGGRLRLYDVSDPRAPDRVASVDEDQSLFKIAFGRGGRTLATVSRPSAETGHRIRIYDVSDPHDPARTATLDDGRNLAKAVFSPDGRSLAIASDLGDGSGGQVRLYDVGAARGPAQVGTIADDADDADDDIYSLAFGPDGHVLTITTPRGDADGTRLRVYDVRDPSNPLPTTTVKDNQDIASVAFSPDGRTVATGSVPNDTNGGRLRLYDLAAPRNPVGTAAIDDDQFLALAAVSPDGHTLAVASARINGRGGRLRLYDINDPHAPALTAAVDDDQGLGAVAFSPDGHTLATSSGGDTARGRLRLYDVSDPRDPVRIAAVDDDQNVVGVAISPDGHTLATTSALPDTDGGRLRLYDISDLRHPRRVASIGDDLSSSLVAFSPDGHTLATASAHGGAGGGRLRLFDVGDPGDPRPTAAIDDDQDLIAVAFSPGGRTLAVTSAVTNVEGGRLRLYDVGDPHHPISMASVDDDQNLSLVAFSPDGRTLATTSAHSTAAGGRLRLYDVTTPREPTRTASVVDEQNLLGLAFSRDGRTLATTGGIGSGGRLRLYDVRGTSALSGRLRPVACGVAAGGMSPAEWRDEVPDIPFVRTC